MDTITDFIQAIEQWKQGLLFLYSCVPAVAGSQVDKPVQGSLLEVKVESEQAFDRVPDFVSFLHEVGENAHHKQQTAF